MLQPVEPVEPMPVPVPVAAVAVVPSPSAWYTFFIHLYIGRRVSKVFTWRHYYRYAKRTHWKLKSCQFGGYVKELVQEHVIGVDEHMWSIQYDDGDSEDMALSELSSVVLCNSDRRYERDESMGNLM